MGLPNWMLIAVGIYWLAEIYYVHQKNFVSFYEPDDNGDYELTWGFFWKMSQNRYWMTTHGVCSSVAFLMWMNQMSDTSRARSIWLHKLLGRISLILFVGTSWPTPVFAYYLDTDLLGRFMVMVLGILTLSYSVGAYVAIRQENLALHRQLAFRLYFLGVGFILFGRVGIVFANLFLPKPTAQHVAIPIVGVATFIGMEVVAYRLESMYNESGSGADTYRIIGIPGLRLKQKTEPAVQVDLEKLM